MRFPPYKSLSVTPEVADDVRKFQGELLALGTNGMPKAFAPPPDLTISEVIAFALRAARQALK